jgi:hypothetical protein
MAEASYARHDGLDGGVTERIVVYFQFGTVR